MTRRSLLYDALADPLPWWFYPGMVASGTLGNMMIQGCTLAPVLGGLVGSLLTTLAFGAVRRGVVGHWR